MFTIVRFNLKGLLALWGLIKRNSEWIKEISDRLASFFACLDIARYLAGNKSSGSTGAKEIVSCFFYINYSN